MNKNGCKIEIYVKKNLVIELKIEKEKESFMIKKKIKLDKWVLIYIRVLCY